jgi:prevent-host-death family protein
VADVSIRDLRNHGGDVIDRVEAGEHLTVTRDGKPVAELSPLAPRPIGRAALLKRWSRLPAVDPRRLRNDLDEVIDPSL